MKTLLLFTFLALTVGFSNVQAQNEENIDKYITAIVASDTILDGNAFEFKIIIRNLQGDFTPPTFSNFDIVGGPNMSTSMQYVNGNMFRESTYTYFLKARNLGEQYIEESYLKLAQEDMETEPISVYILDNPEQIRKDYRVSSKTESPLIFPFGKQSEPELKKKPKRKLKKI